MARTVDPAPTTRPLLVELNWAIRFYDLDPAGVVNHIVYVRWLSDLRHELLAQAMPVAQIVAQGLAPAVTETHIHYRAPLRLGEAVQGRMWVTSLGRATWRVAAVIGHGPREAATATQAGCFVALDTLRPVRIPAALRQHYQAVLQSDAS